MAFKFPQAQPIQLGPSGQSPVPNIAELLMKSGASAPQQNIGSMAQTIIGALLQKQAQRTADERRAANAADYATVLKMFGRGGDATVRPVAGAGAGSPPGVLAPAGGAGAGSVPITQHDRANLQAAHQIKAYADVTSPYDIKPGYRAGSSEALRAGLAETGNNPALVEAFGPLVAQFIAAENAPPERLTGKDRFIVVDGQLVDLAPEGGGDPDVVISGVAGQQEWSSIAKRAANELGFRDPAEALAQKPNKMMAVIRRMNEKSGMNIHMGDKFRDETKLAQRQRVVAEYKDEAAMKTRDQIRSGAEAARENLVLMEQTNELVRSSPNTGFGTAAALWFKKAVHAIAPALLTDEDRKTIATMEALNSANITIAMKVFAAMVKGSISDKEGSQFREAAPGLANTQEGNKLLLLMLTEGMRRAIDREAFLQEWEAGPGEGTMMGKDEYGNTFEQAWDKRAGSFIEPFREQLVALTWGESNLQLSYDPQDQATRAVADYAQNAIRQGKPMDEVIKRMRELGVHESMLNWRREGGRF